MEDKQTTCRRNKRKSAEPKRREVLLKRFRSWDSGGSSEDEECGTSGQAASSMPVSASGAVDRPASSDSGCHSATSSEGPAENWTSSGTRQSVIVSRTTAEREETVEDEDDLDKSARPRNYYKSMNRQRRIEANARERTRVHTISAAFESLRRAVPAYADSQKLSKLAILRIASSYILSLACLNNMDYSQDRGTPSFAECVQLCTTTIQAEGKARRRTKE